eukprot:m51a1_g8511 hypothetical protein (304) ;mRNA; f:77487-79910
MFDSAAHGSGTEVGQGKVTWALVRGRRQWRRLFPFADDQRLSFAGRFAISDDSPQEEVALLAARERLAGSNVACGLAFPGSQRPGESPAYLTAVPLTPKIPGVGSFYATAAHAVCGARTVHLTWEPCARYERCPRTTPAAVVDVSFPDGICAGDTFPDSDEPLRGPRPDLALLHMPEGCDGGSGDEAVARARKVLSEWDDEGVCDWWARSAGVGPVVCANEGYVLRRPGVGLRASHPAFAFAYAAVVLPLLGAARLSATQCRAVAEYAAFHCESFERHGLSSADEVPLPLERSGSRGKASSLP